MNNNKKDTINGDYDSLRNVKLNDRVEFPEVLNLYEFTTSQVLQNTKRMMKKNS